MRAEIRDYRGVERADIDLSQIALVAGNNEQGKSCVAEAIGAALTGNAIPIANVLKKDAKLLVKDGADAARATVTDGPQEITVLWPGCTVKVSDEHGWIETDYAAGFSHVLDLNDRDRAKVLAHYMDSTPTKKDIELAAADAGYSEAAVAKIVESIESNGWDATYKKTRDYTVNLKGQWQGITGEKYGAKKGESFRLDDGGPIRGFLVECLATAEKAVLDTAGVVAVSEAEVAALERLAGAKIESKIDVNNELNKARDLLDGLVADRASMPDDPEDVGGSLGKKPLACPECGVALSLLGAPGGKTRLIPHIEPEKVKPLSDSVIKRRDALDARLVEGKKVVGELEGKIITIQQQEKDAESAKKRLKEIDAAPKLDEAAVELAKDQVGDARSALTEFDNKVKAHKVHGDLAKNDLLIKVLAPDGLRKRVLAAKLGDFNSRLDTLSETAGWPQVLFDEDLNCHYGKRPFWAASMSGRWRARAVIQVAMAQIDKSAAVILDEADMLDTQGRNGLFKMLGSIAPKALVCMTFGGRDRAPQLKLAKLGVSYWIENGIAEEL